MAFFKGKLLDVGCGIMPYRDIIKAQAKVTEYIGMDLQNSEVYGHAKPDLFWDGFNIPMENETVDSIMLTEVLEHCPEPQKVLRDINRVLKTDGTVVFSVPFLWYLHESPWDFYRYTPFAIKKMFEDNGFIFEKLETYGSNDLAFLHSYLIWLKKSALPKFMRFAIYLCTLPIILLFLAFAKSKNRSKFSDGQIFIGIVGVAKKVK
ncbi:MAG: class I SAM-dependent methyltransferase [Chitinophagaceae bacterium]|nr:class I SAM-dependent methyltransferase [Chitinophagaceae bacterium]